MWTISKLLVAVEASSGEILLSGLFLAEFSQFLFIFFLFF